MRKVTIIALLIVVCASLSVVSLQPACAVGKYCLAYWRECGAYENQAPPAGSFGNHSCYIHVWNEDGTPRAGVTLYTDWGVNMGTTDANGHTAATLNRPNSYNFQVRDGSNLTDTSPLFSTERAPNWGHYSFEVGFMYKSDSSNPGTFDTSYTGVLNSTSDQPCNLDAPCTRSLAYYSTDPTNYCSDAYSLGNGSDSFGQTFVATGNRVVAARCHSTIGGGGHLWYSAAILAGGPNGTQIGPTTTSREVVSDEYSAVLVRWGINAVPVTPGQTYYIKFTRVGGSFNVYHVNANNYASGQYYENGVAQPGTDLEGMVVCASVPQNGTIAGNVKDSLNSNMSGVTVSTNTGGYSATTDANGNYTIADVAAGAYNVTASKSGFTPQTLTGKVVSANSTTTANFVLTDASAPPAPSVTDDGVYTANLAQLHASWSASDPESGIAEYSYAIGTSAGATNVVGWTSTGLSTSVTRSVALTPGVHYYFSVKAKNGAGAWSTAGNSDGITAAEVMSIADSRARADGAVVALQGNVVTRKGSGCFWIEDSGRTGGIKVDASTTAARSNRLDVCGVLATDSGERIVSAPVVSNITAGTAIRPYGLGGGALSGKPLGVHTPGAQDALGPNNVGLLVRCWGQVADQATDGFTMNDGGRDITVLTGSLVKPANGMLATATGIGGLAPDGPGYSPVLRVLDQEDLAVVPRDGAFGSITGRVTANGSGVSGASVATSAGGYSTNTDTNGYYTLSSVKEGLYSVTASKSGYISAAQSVVVVKDEVTTCNLAIIPNVGTISGVVRDGGSTLGGATVSTNTGGYTTTSASDGSYSLANVAPGTYNVTASKTGYNSSTQTGLAVTANTTTTANFTLTIQVGTLSGNVKSSAGANLAGVSIATNTGGYTATTDANGNYTISNVLPGTYNVAASKTGYNTSTQTGKVVTANATTTVNFTLTANTVTVYIDKFNGNWIDGSIGKIPEGWTYWGMGAPANTWRETARILPPNDGTNSSYNVTMQGYCDWQTGSIIIYRNFRGNDWAAPGTTIDWSKPVYLRADVLGNDRGTGTTWKTWFYPTNYERTNGQTEWGDNGLPNGTWQTVTCTLTPGLNNGTVSGLLIVEVYFDFMGKAFTGFNDLVWENVRMEYTPVGW